MNSDELKAIGDRIYNRRKAVGLTQEHLAEKMDVSIQMISNLERGNKAIRIDNLIKLCAILGTSTDYILLGCRGESDLGETAQKLARLPEDDFHLVRSLIERLAEL